MGNIRNFVTGFKVLAKLVSRLQTLRKYSSLIELQAGLCASRLNDCDTVPAIYPELSMIDQLCPQKLNSCTAILSLSANELSGHPNPLKALSVWLSWLERWSHSTKRDLVTDQSNPKVESSSLSTDKNLSF
ncbi:Uncharacterized protein HZ326_17881 [Fusarium oxysporum f. sp. albedinis]|nr:Uncharacterized protein HZ326_17881 [Fusarium oxysporum f. sp. albedinis]